jgi:hypothetical protein
LAFASERAGARLTGHGFVLAWMDVGDALISLSTAGGHGRSSPRSAGATVISEPADKFWGGRVYEAKDPEGQHWEFSERDRKLDSTEWKLPPGIKMGA